VVEDFLQVLMDLFEFNQNRLLTEIMNLKPTGWLITSGLVFKRPEYVAELYVQPVKVLGVSGFVPDADFEEDSEALSEGLETSAVDTAQVFVSEFFEVREFSLRDDLGQRGGGGGPSDFSKSLLESWAWREAGMSEVGCLLLGLEVVQTSLGCR
jgi:hypothetical protein